MPLFMTPEEVYRFLYSEEAKSTYDCPKCDGRIKVVIINEYNFRWTCQSCNRDYGYNTRKPIT